MSSKPLYAFVAAISMLVFGFIVFAQDSGDKDKTKTTVQTVQVFSGTFSIPLGLSSVPPPPDGLNIRDGFATEVKLGTVDLSAYKEVRVNVVSVQPGSFSTRVRVALVNSADCPSTVGFHNYESFGCALTSMDASRFGINPADAHSLRFLEVNFLYDAFATAVYELPGTILDVVAAGTTTNGATANIQVTIYGRP